MDISHLHKMTVGEVVADDFRTAEVFKKAGIDFCCGGKQGVNEACARHGIEFSHLQKEIKDVTLLPVSPSMNYREWEPGFLMDYIVNTHHKYTEKTLPELKFYTRKIADVHGSNHPELVEVAHKFAQVHDELANHLKREEEVFFPWVREMIANPTPKISKKLIEEHSALHSEHDFAGSTMDDINKITKGYLLPEEACNTYRVCFKLLEQFEDDLHTHVHLENNILFPKVMQLIENNQL